MRERQMESVAAGDFSYIIDTISKYRRVQLIMAGQLVVTLGDTSAIWRAHQKNVTDFDILFKMLSCKPDKEFVFSYKLIG